MNKERLGNMKKEKSGFPCYDCEHNKDGYCEQQGKVSSVSNPVEYMADNIHENYLSDDWNRTAEILGWGKSEEGKENFDYNKKVRAEEFGEFKKLCPWIDRLIEIAVATHK